MIKIAKAYLRQAVCRLEDAENALTKRNYAYAFRLSQESVELCLKACLKLVGLEYPKVHDVSPVLQKFPHKFPEHFRNEIGFLTETSKRLASKRELSFYGGEEDFLAPEEVISENDAKDAIINAKKVYEICENLVERGGRRRHAANPPNFC